LSGLIDQSQVAISEKDKEKRKKFTKNTEMKAKSVKFYQIIAIKGQWTRI